MNREWSDCHKLIQQHLKKEDTFDEGISLLLGLRQTLMAQAEAWRELPREGFSAMPIKGAEPLVFDLWHTFRIEDIVANTLIRGEREVLYTGGFLEKTRSPFATTANELSWEQITQLAQSVDIDALYDYCRAVKESTDSLLRGLSFAEQKRRFGENDIERIFAAGGVSKDENAAWLADYWCKKDIRGLILMPFSRHWILHIESGNRVFERLKK